MNSGRISTIIFIIVLSCESHCRQLERTFDLFYYDGLASQDEVIRLTIGKDLCLLMLERRTLFGMVLM